MGIHTASSECQKKLRKILEGLVAVQNIQDDIAVHRKGEEYNWRLEAILARMEKYGITL